MQRYSKAPHSLHLSLSQYINVSEFACDYKVIHELMSISISPHRNHISIH